MSTELKKKKHTIISRNTEKILEKMQYTRLPWWAAVKNPSASSGDMGSIPDLGRAHVPRGSEGCTHNY